MTIPRYLAVGTLAVRFRVMHMRGIIGLKVASASLSNCWDTNLCFENDYVVQTFSDTVQFETWDVHLDAGWVILSDGRITVFPPAPTAPAATTPS